jgi:DNA-binding PadR family transcriptional regulator
MLLAPLPPLTSLQFLVLGTLLDVERPGRVVRELLAAHGVRRTPAAFYQMMARLEKASLVAGWYEQVVVGDQAVTERRYRLTDSGTRLWRQTRDFYRKPAFGRVRWSDA